jgi:putative ABC transport system permease protein
MDTIKKDLLHAIRLFLNRPGFTIVALLTIALGIGINTAMFSVVNGVLLRPLPFPNPDRLTGIFTLIKGADLDIFSPTNFLDVQAQNTSFESVAAYTTAPFDLSTGAEPEALAAAKVSADFFRVLGVNPFLGRTFRSSDDTPGNNRVVVLSYELWKEKFNGDANMIGRSFIVNGISCSVIGILPQHVEFPENVKIWAPIAFSKEERTYRGSTYLNVIGRLKPAITLDAAKKELQIIGARLAKDFPDSNRNLGMTALLLRDALVGNVQKSLLVLAGAVGFVLLIACANLANLLVASASTRTREFAVRSALGASRRRLLYQLIVESLVLSLSGGLLGALFALWSLPALRALSPSQLPRIQEITMDWRVLFFTLLISIVTGLLFGLTPSLGFSHPDIQESLKEGARTLGPSRKSKSLGNALIVAEVSAVLVLLSGAGLMIRSFSQLRSVNPGFQPQNVVSFQLTLPESKYGDRSRILPFATQLLERTRAIPATESVALASPSPFSGDQEVSDVFFRIGGRPEPAPGEFPLADLTRVTPDYFRTMRIPILRGRVFSPEDRGDSMKVMIISSALAKTFFGDTDPIGQKIVLSRTNPITFEIVGVVGDVKHIRLNAEIRPEIYLAYFQFPFPGFTVLSRTANFHQFASNAKTQVWSIDRDLPLRFLTPVDNIIGGSLAPARAGMFLISGFAVLALMLAVIGLYGLIAYSVSQRTREIGIRVALGAKRKNILTLILRSGMLLAMIGTGIGIFASLALTRFLSSLLFQVSPRDPIVFLCVSVMLLFTAFLACYLPARKASRVNPLTALRYE